MDEYSQSNAEDTEVATQVAISQTTLIASFIGIALVSALFWIKPIQSFLQKIAIKNPTIGTILAMSAPVIGLLAGLGASIPAIKWATTAKVGASRRGRFEAMTNELKNPALFATLNQEQEKQIQELSQNIELEDKDKKRLKKFKSMGVNPLDSFKTLKNLYKGEKTYKSAKAEFENKLNENITQFDTPLSEEQILAAKKDQQILSDMVRKIDIASQDYAENAELATNTITTLAIGSGALIGWTTNKLSKLLKINGSTKIKILKWGVSLGIPLAFSIYATKIQKQASRIARHKIKQEMTNNPAELIYVNEQDIAKITNVKSNKKKPKLNIFKFFTQLLKDNKEYQQYLKTDAIAQIKRHKAIDKIQLSEEQIQKAKSLQTNMFKTFNKIDEKSQTYAESVEAIGAITAQLATCLGGFAILGLGLTTLKNYRQDIHSGVKSLYTKLFPKFIIPYAIIIIPTIIIDILTTKEQKKASRVADMLALKDLEDYRHYADYSHQKTQKQTIAKTNESSLVKQFLGSKTFNRT